MPEDSQSQPVNLQEGQEGAAGSSRGRVAQRRAVRPSTSTLMRGGAWGVLGVGGGCRQTDWD